MPSLPLAHVASGTVNGLQASVQALVAAVSGSDGVIQVVRGDDAVAFGRGRGTHSLARGSARRSYGAMRRSPPRRRSSCRPSGKLVLDTECKGAGVRCPNA